MTHFVQKATAQSTTGSSSSAAITFIGTPVKGNLWVAVIATDRTPADPSSSTPSWTDYHTSGDIASTGAQLIFIWGTFGATPSTTITVSLGYAAKWIMGAMEYRAAGTPERETNPPFIPGSAGARSGAVTALNGVSIDWDENDDRDRVIVGAFVVPSTGSAATVSAEKFDSSTTGVTERYDTQIDTTGLLLNIFDRELAVSDCTNFMTSSATLSQATIGGYGIAASIFFSVPNRSAAGTEPQATASLARKLTGSRALAGALATMTGSLTKFKAHAAALAGDLPTMTGALTRSRNRLYALAGAQPTATASLAGILVNISRALAGLQPAPSASLTVLGVFLRGLTGQLATISGALSRTAGAFARALAGAEPSMSGYVHKLGSAQNEDLGATMEAPNGNLSIVVVRVRHLAATVPAPSGVLHWRRAHHTVTRHALNATPLTRSA